MSFVNSRCSSADSPAGVKRGSPSPHKPRMEANAGWGSGRLPPRKEREATHPPSEGHLHGAREQAQEGLGEKARPSFSSPACHHPHPPSRAKSPKEKPAINKDKRGGAPAERRYTLVCAARAQLGGGEPASTERTVWPTAGPWMPREGEEDEGRVVKHT